MKQKLSIILILGLVIFIIVKNNNLRKTYLEESNTVGVYINNELSDKIPSKDEATFYKAICDDENVSVSWDNDSWGLLLKNLTKKAKCNLYFYQGDTVFNFDYTGSEQTFTAPVSGTYKLETWGAQGGDYYNAFSGLGGYSVGNIELNKSDILYIAVGGKGKDGFKSANGSNISAGGYNGGGSGGRGYNFEYNTGSGGGGATSIQNMYLNDGQLRNYAKNVSNVLIVSGGGGGGGGYAGYAGSAGGYKGSPSFSRTTNSITWGGNSIGATQESGYAFGQGQNANDKSSGGAYGCEGNGGGGGGYYGGFSNLSINTYSDDAGAGGSSYIGNPILKDKIMYCYNCEESNEESAKTISTTCSEETPTENCAKKGNGYARITLVSIGE